MKDFWMAILQTFIPLFVAVDAIGVLPIFMSLTQKIDKEQRRKIIFQSMITALCLAIAFVFLGKWIFKFLGITVGDFMIAGGIVLFGIAILDILHPNRKRYAEGGALGAVPIGTPLIAGPAVLTTSLLLIGEYGILITLISVTVNILLAGIIFYLSDYISKALGEAGSKAMSKIIHLFLAAIAVMMIRKGVVMLIHLI